MEVLYSAQFDLNCSQDQVLSFKKGDRFLPLSNKRIDENWKYGVGLWGNIGFFPVSYVKQEEVSREEFIHCMDVILDTFGRHNTGHYTRQQRDAIQELSMRRTLLLSPIHSPKDAEKPLKVATDPAKTLSAVTDAVKPRVKVGSSSHPPHLTNDISPKTIKKMEKTEKAAISPQSKLKEVEEKVRGGLIKVKQEMPSPAKEVTKSHLEHHINETPVVNTLPTAKSNANVSQPVKVLQRTKQSIGDTLNPVADHSANFNESVGDSKVTSDPAKTDFESPKCSDVLIPPWLVPRLVENVRHKTQLSHKNSKVTIGVVIETLQDALPDFNPIWGQLKYNLDMLETIKDEKIDVIVSEDHQKLLHIFKKLWCCKNDEQQRSWPVHEDETLIGGLLHDLNLILRDADPNITIETVKVDDYELVNLLATYYQMEPRKLLRVKMLEVFVTLCKLDVKVVGQLLMSVLPMELARDMQCSFDDIDKLEKSAYVLTIIFSTQQKPPNAIFEYINNVFLDFLFDKVEIFLREDDEDIGSRFLSVLLAINLHFDDVKTNLVFSCLEERHDARMLTEKLVFYVNREEDPTCILENGPKKPNSVLKFLVDFFAFSELVDKMFYLNDVKVLLDIIVRQLTDYVPGEEIRQWYLRLVKNVLLNSGYEEHFHQQRGLEKCLNTVLSYQEPCVKEVLIVKEILALFPTWFSISI